MAVLETKRLILVESGEVLCGPGYNTCETLIAFKWANGMTNYLVGWRAGTMDYREWEAWEDEALCRLWPAASGADIDQIKAALQPGRKVSYMEARVRKLGVSTSANRPVAWRKACKALERSYGKRNPDIKYLLLPIQAENTLDLRECLAVREGDDEWMQVPDEVIQGGAGTFG